MSATPNQPRETAMPSPSTALRRCECEHAVHMDDMPQYDPAAHPYMAEVVMGASDGWGKTPAGEICRECLEHPGMDVWVSAIECCPGEWVNVERYDPEHPPTCPRCGSTFHPA